MPNDPSKMMYHVNIQDTYVKSGDSASGIISGELNPGSEASKQPRLLRSHASVSCKKSQTQVGIRYHGERVSSIILGPMPTPQWETFQNFRRMYQNPWVRDPISYYRTLISIKQLPQHLSMAMWWNLPRALQVVKEANSPALESLSKSSTLLPSGEYLVCFGVQVLKSLGIPRWATPPTTILKHTSTAIAKHPVTLTEPIVDESQIRGLTKSSKR